MEEADISFFQAWLRAKYAVTIRPGKIGAANEDFEKIGTRFHTWVKDNTDKIKLASANDFNDFVTTNMVFYMKVFTKIYEARKVFKKSLEHLFYTQQWGFGYSLADSLLLAPICLDEQLGNN